MKRCLLWIFIFISFLGVGCTSKEKEVVSNEEENDPISRVSLAFTGDLLFEQPFYDALDHYQFGTYFDSVKPYLKGDFVIGNQEVPIGGSELGVSGVAFSFNAPKEVADQLAIVGFNVMTLSNNHSFDRSYQGIINTVTYLNDANIIPVGMYTNENEQTPYTILEKNGIKIALLAYTYDTNIAPDEQHRFMVKTFLNDARVFDDIHKEMLINDVRMAQDVADFVIVAMHWGNEFTYRINAIQQEASQLLNSLGVDLIIGNHSHCLQTMDVLTNDDGKQTVVFYSLGNFVSATADVDRASVDFTNMYQIGGIVNLDIIYSKDTKEVSIENMKLVPIVNHFEHNYQNFQLIPLSQYTEDLASKHYQREFSSNFNLDWLHQQIQSLFEGKIALEQ